MTTVTATTNATPAIRPIPLFALHCSAKNQRKRDPSPEGIEQLAANIAAAGGKLIQNLVVIEERKGKATHGVIAGGRRLRALQLLQKRGLIAKDHAVDCRLVDAAHAVEISLSENLHREEMHPADEFVAFAKLVDNGQSEDDIATRHGVSVGIVRARLALANLSPKALQLFREDKLTLGHVKALTLTKDHAKQDALLQGPHLPQEWQLRNALTENIIPSTDRRAVYVGIDAYKAAGGIVTADLFREGVCYFDDAPLLASLTLAKLNKAADKLRKTLAWVDVFPCGIDYQERSKYGHAPTVRAEPDADTAAQLLTLSQELAAAEADVERFDAGTGSSLDDDDDTGWIAASERVDDIAAKISEIEATLMHPDPEAAPLLGAIVGIGHNGKLEKHTGLVRPEDKAKLRKAAAPNSTDGPDAGAEGAEAKAGDPNPVRIDLSTLLTAVAQDALADNVHVALRALAYQLTLTLARPWADTGLSIRATDHTQITRTESLANNPVAAACDARAEKWDSILPSDDDALWAWCLAADDATIHALLAYNAARSLTAVEGNGKLAAAAPVIAALRVDLTQHWTPESGYFSRVKKADTLAALATHGHTGKELAKAKRDALAAIAAERLTGTGWLPPTLAAHQRSA